MKQNLIITEYYVSIEETERSRRVNAALSFILSHPKNTDFVSDNNGNGKNGVDEDG